MTKITTYLFPNIFLLGALLHCHTVQAAETQLTTAEQGRVLQTQDAASSASGINVKAPPPYDHGKQYVILQQKPNACGPAALANYLTFGLDKPTSEEDLIKADSDFNIEYSISDMVKMASTRDVVIKAYEISWGKLLAQPSVAGVVRLIIQQKSDSQDTTSTAHFAMLAGIDAGIVTLKDPARGQLRMTKEAFLQEWETQKGSGRGYFLTSKLLTN